MKKKALSIVLLLSCVQMYAVDAKGKREYTEEEKNKAATMIQHAFKQYKARKEKAGLEATNDRDDNDGDGAQERRVSGDDAAVLDNTGTGDATGSDNDDNDGNDGGSDSLNGDNQNGATKVANDTLEAANERRKSEDVDAPDYEEINLNDTNKDAENIKKNNGKGLSSNVSHDEENDCLSRTLKNIHWFIIGDRVEEEKKKN